MPAIICETDRLELFTLDHEEFEDAQLFNQFVMADDQGYFQFSQGRKLIDKNSDQHQQVLRLMSLHKRLNGASLPIYFREKGSNEVAGMFRSYHRDFKSRLVPYVRKKYHGLGYAKEVYLACDGYLAPRGRFVREEFVLATNKPSIRLHHSMGFKAQELYNCVETMDMPYRQGKGHAILRLAR